jgi:hypothetical protein
MNKEKYYLEPGSGNSGSVDNNGENSAELNNKKNDKINNDFHINTFN